jgi:hypothetical protein
MFMMSPLVGLLVVEGLQYRIAINCSRLTWLMELLLLLLGWLLHWLFLVFTI